MTPNNNNSKDNSNKKQQLNNTMAESIPTTMKAWLYSSTTGGLEKNLTLDSTVGTPSASLQPGQVLAQVISVSINPADYKVPEMPIVSRLLITKPASPGMEFAGRVVATGSDVSDFKPGQLVYGTVGAPGKFGSLREYIAVDTRHIVAVPEGVDLDQAATVGCAAQTAYQSLVPYVSKGDKVFINGGSGGCGAFAIQMAKLLGCEVTTTCSSRNVQLCKDLGADDVIDYTTQDVLETLKEHGQVYNHVVDHIGVPGDLYSQSDSFLRPGKVFLQVGGEILNYAARLVRPGFLGGGTRKYVILMMKVNNDDMYQVGQWMHEGKIRAQIDSTYEFSNVVKAFEKLRTGRSRGKIVIHVSEKP